MEGARIIQVIETISNRGNGTENNPYREVIQYWDFEGKLLAEVDPFKNIENKEVR